LGEELLTDNKSAKRNRSGQQRLPNRSGLVGARLIALVRSVS
jgi:hypothetical protein